MSDFFTTTEYSKGTVDYLLNQLNTTLSAAISAAQTAAIAYTNITVASLLASHQLTQVDTYGAACAGEVIPAGILTHWISIPVTIRTGGKLPYISLQAVTDDMAFDTDWASCSLQAAIDAGLGQLQIGITDTSGTGLTLSSHAVVAVIIAWR
jgi:hypothetical protein